MQNKCFFIESPLSDGPDYKRAYKIIKPRHFDILTQLVIKVTVVILALVDYGKMTIAEHGTTETNVQCSPSAVMVCG